FGKLIVSGCSKGHPDLQKVDRPGDNAQRGVYASSRDLKVFVQIEVIEQRVLVEIFGKQLPRLVPQAGYSNPSAKKDHVIIISAVRDTPLIGCALRFYFLLLKWYRFDVRKILIVRAGWIEQGLWTDQVVEVREPRGRIVVGA